MTADPKSERFMIRMARDERKMLAELAELDGVSEANVVRQLLRRAHAERLGKGAGSAKRKRK
jgi:hypothetical protein